MAKEIPEKARFEKVNCDISYMKKKHVSVQPDEQFSEPQAKVLTLMQFARKAGKLVYGYEQCIKQMEKNKIKLLLYTTDLSQNTKNKLMNYLKHSDNILKMKEFGTQEELSASLGLPFTGIIGILDNNFASKIITYLNG
ncbi:MAG: ribosomal L7Ae/L30e/S12e/Gadd45 family protein [Candidatus Cloacimonetes bacterium]|nr:ribosomal L7Ae/L30e/S12e/Gadd45 family protein [Candidatus Cloacimonadota bacterium]